MVDFRVQLEWGIHGTGAYNPVTDIFTVASGHDGGSIGLNALLGFALRDANNRIFRVRSNTATVISGGSFQVEVFGIAPQPDPVDGSCIIDAPAAYYEVGGGLVSGAPPPTGYPTIATINPQPSGFQPTSYLTDVYSSDVKLGVRMQNALLTPVSAETPLTTFVAPSAAGVGTLGVVTEVQLFPGCVGSPPSSWDCAICSDRTRLIVRWVRSVVSGVVDNTTHQVKVYRKQVTPVSTGYSLLATVGVLGDYGDCSPLVNYGLLGPAQGQFQDHFAICDYPPGSQPAQSYQYKFELVRITDAQLQSTVESSVLGFASGRICTI